MDWIDYYRKQPPDVRQHARLIPREIVEDLRHDPADAEYGRVFYLNDGPGCPGILLGYLNGRAVVVLGYHVNDNPDPSEHRWGHYPMLGALDPDCPECFGTGLRGGLHVACGRGCEVVVALIGLLLASCALPPVEERARQNLLQLNAERRVNGRRALSWEEYLAPHRHAPLSWDSMLSFGPYHSYLYQRR